MEAYAQDIPPGVCQCGCGQKTQVITASVARQGRVRGEFSRFVQHHRTSPYGQDIFTPAWARSEAGAWFLGLFMTDGTLDKSRVLRISLKDRDAVEAAARALGGDKSVVKRNFPPNDSQWLLSVSLKSVWPRAESLGLWAGAKSGREFVPVGLQDNPHFWRGCVEGDGWVSADPKVAAVGLCGSGDTLPEGFADYCFSVLGRRPSVNTHVAPGYNGTGVRMYVVKVNGQEAAQVARSLYGSCSFFMERKRARAAAVSEVMAEKQRRAIAREQAVIRRYVDGDSVDEICKQVEVSGTYLYSTLRKNNVTLRGRSRGKKNRA